MYYRSGRYGLFWGCSHFSGDNELSCKYSINKIETPKGFQDLSEATNNLKQKSNIQDNTLIHETFDDKKFTVRKDAIAYAKKIAMTKKTTVNVVEKDGYWLVELKHSD